MLIINKIRAAVAALLIFVVVVAHPANARPYQYIPEIPGWIPVYIRQGDQPLSEIHPALAEAFREDIQSIQLDDSATKNLLADGNEISAESKSVKENSQSIDVNPTVETNDFSQKTEAFDDDNDDHSVVMKIAKPSAFDKAELKRLAKEHKFNKKNE